MSGRPKTPLDLPCRPSMVVILDVGPESMRALGIRMFQVETKDPAFCTLRTDTMAFCKGIGL